MVSRRESRIKAKVKGIKPKKKKYSTRSKIRGNQFRAGKRGHAAQYITRTQAIRKLQISLANFRRICIMKGVYPRQPRRALQGKMKTYYLKKDIAYMEHDPIMQHFAKMSAWKERMAKAKREGRNDDIKTLMNLKPVYSFASIIKQRYPYFRHALEDLDDCLTLVFYFASLSSQYRHAKYNIIMECKELSIQFLYYIMKAHALRKVFVSIKGIYYQAEIQSHTITWIAPHSFVSPPQKSSDYKVMNAFITFYLSFLKFVNFKLYHQIGLNYPPSWNTIKERKGKSLDSLLTKEYMANLQAEREKKKPIKRAPSNPEQIELSKARISSLKETLESIEPGEEGPEEVPEEEEKKEDDNADEEVFQTDDAVKQRKQEEAYEGLFSALHFWLSREVPRESLEFVIKCFGGKVSWDGNGNEETKSITHVVTDRPNADTSNPARDYVQPQWVYDCINNRILLPVDQYGPNRVLPPHLSPFVDDYSIGYVPDYRRELDKYYFEKTGINRAGSALLPLFKKEQEMVDQEKEHFKELESERRGIYLEPKKEKPEDEIPLLRKTFNQKQEESKVALRLLSQEKRRILSRYQRNVKRRERYVLNLTKRKVLLKTGKAVIKDGLYTDLTPKKPQKRKPSLYALPFDHPAWIGGRRRRPFVHPTINKQRYIRPIRGTLLKQRMRLQREQQREYEQ